MLFANEPSRDHVPPLLAAKCFSSKRTTHFLLDSKRIIKDGLATLGVARGRCGGRRGGGWPWAFRFLSIAKVPAKFPSFRGSFLYVIKQRNPQAHEKGASFARGLGAPRSSALSAERRCSFP